MKRSSVSLLILLFAAAWLGPGAAVSGTAETVRVTARQTHQQLPTYGYSRVLVELENLDFSQAHQVRLSDRITLTQTPIAIHRQVSLAPGAHARVEILRPSYYYAGWSRGLYVAVDGKEKKRISPTPETTTIFNGNNHSVNWRILFSRSITPGLFQSIWEKRYQKKKKTPKKRHRYSRYSSVINPMPRLDRSEIEPQEWSQSWLAYSSYPIIVLDRTDLKRLPPPVVTALRRWVECGGILGIAGLTHLPPNWQGIEKDYTTPRTISNAGFGCFTVLPDLRDTTLSSKECAALDAFKQVIGTRELTFSNQLQGPNTTFLPVIKTFHTAYFGIFFCLLFFAILVGPANLIFLTNHNRRAWILWTMPVLAIGTTLIVLVYSLIYEGITPTTRMTAITVLNTQNHHAVTLGLVGYYCPITPMSGLHFSPDTEVTAPNYGQNQCGDVYWEADQHFSAGWLKPRLPTYFRLRKNESRSERATLYRAADGSLSVFNGLGADLDSFQYTDSAGRLYEAEHVRAGAKVSLHPGAKINYMAPPASIYLNPKWTPENYTSSRPKPATYLARITDKSPFLEPGLQNPGHFHAQSLVIGVGVTEESAP